MRSIFYAFFPLTILFTMLGLSHAAEVSPFYTRDHSPFVQVYGLPPAEGASITPRGSLLVRGVYNLANNSVIDWSHDENTLVLYWSPLYWEPNLVQDGEMSRFDISLRYGLTKHVEIGVDVPYIIHSKGIMDDFIESFHELFSASDGAARSRLGKGGLKYKYRQNANVFVDFTEPAAGVGDVRLTGALSLYHDGMENSRALALRAAVKFPTGNSGELTGSGGTDLSIELAGSDGMTLSALDLTCWGSAGVLFTGSGEVIDELRRDRVVFGSIGVGWSPLAWLSPKLQVDWHSPFYQNTVMKPLGNWSAQIVAGGEFRLPRKVLLDLAVAEDLNVKTAPDVTFHLAMRRLF